MSQQIVFSLYIINKSGGLIYQSDFSKDAAKHPPNTHLRLGSTFHSMYTIASRIGPMGNSSGIQILESDSFRLQCLQVPTGTTFFIIASKNHNGLENLLRIIYELYVDYVLKNPFYELEQPIHCQLFDMNLEKLLRTDK
eukprot:TRINITY_DN7943_c0_g1_i2.p1 TRINITY_DN7943_c0_g1~~TRINITY_DN7943_c0_g1_i2.p1  ORF type:complete len:139 (+),score=42.01 TRINITY_DN7943_c0_g1_i2:55-471(+)